MLCVTSAALGAGRFLAVVCFFLDFATGFAAGFRSERWRLWLLLFQFRQARFFAVSGSTRSYLHFSPLKRCRRFVSALLVPTIVRCRGLRYGYILSHLDSVALVSLGASVLAALTM